MIKNGTPLQGGNGANKDLLQRIVDLDSRYYEMRKARGEASSTATTYLAGESSRMSPVPSGIDPLGSDADYHYRTERNYFLMVERARAAVRNHPLVEQGINRLLANLRITGIALDCNSGDATADAAIKAKWRAWASDKQLVDHEQLRDFDALVAQSVFNQVVDGDVLHLPLVTGALQTWESHHIRSPFGHRPTQSDQDGIIHGAEVRGGRVVAYHLTPFRIPFGRSVTRLSQTRRFEVFDGDGNQVVFYAGFCHRFTQRRGVSRLSPPRESMNGFDDLNYAHIKTSLRRALISYLMENQTSQQVPGLDGGPLPQAGDRYEEEGALGLKTVVVEFSGEPAQVIKAPAGHKIQGWNANLPGQGFFDQAALLLTMLSVNLDLPLSFLLLDGSLVNFHGGRMTFDQVKLRMQELQRHVIMTRHWPIYRWKLRQWLTPGSPHFDFNLAAMARAGANFEAVTFRPRGWPYVKPLEDVAAADVAERRNIRSLREIYADQGDDFDSKMPQIIADRAAWVRESLRIAREIVTDNDDLELSIPQLASELRYGQSDPAGVQLTMNAGGDVEPDQPPRRTDREDD